MASAIIEFTNPFNGKIKSAPVGFSWTTLFFGAWPSLFRGHWSGFFIQLLCYVVTFGLSALVFPFIYNKMYIRHLIGDGFKVQHTSADPKVIASRLGMALPMLAA
ncbi:MAG: hypothetical protein ABIV25_02990 [Paracoccaceae bacterium]